jgi:hypothetical protein
MITTSDVVAIADGTIALFDSPTIKVIPRNNSTKSTVSCLIQFWDGDTVVAEYLTEPTATSLDSTTQSVSGFTRKFQAAAEEVVKGYLEGVAANSGATFTIV